MDNKKKRVKNEKIGLLTISGVNGYLLTRVRSLLEKTHCVKAIEHFFMQNFSDINAEVSANETHILRLLSFD